MENLENEEVVNNEGQQIPKTYTEEEVIAIREQMKEDNQKAFDKRWGREKSKMERKFEKETAKQNELIELLKNQTQSNNIDDLLEMSYKQYGVQKPTPKLDSRDEERLGKLDAEEILELQDDKAIEEEAERLSYLDRTVREHATFMELSKYLSKQKEFQKRKQEINDLGIDEEEIDNDEFREFANNYKETTPLKTIYENYIATKPPKEKPFSPGSLQDSNKENKNVVKEFYSFEESKKFTRKDFKANPALYKAVCDSMSKWGKK